MSFQNAAIAPSILPQKSEKLTVLPISDLHLPRPKSQIILENRRYLDRIDFAVLLGDMVSAYGTDSEYGAVRDFLSRLNRPYTAICGNHEWHFQEFHEASGLYGDVWEQAPDAEQRAHIEKFRQFYGLPELWRAFDHLLGHFVFLSLDCVGHWKQETLSEAQLEFLLSQVERAEQKPLFLFCHAPLMLRTRLDMVYYEEERSGCIELIGEVRRVLERRAAPSFWMSGHIHLHPDHYLFPPYRCGGNVWQIHCPDSCGYGRWKRDQTAPSTYDGPFSRHLEIDGRGVNFVTHNHRSQSDCGAFRVDF